MTEPNTTPTPSFDVAAWEVERRAHEAAQAAIRPVNKSALFSVLSAAGITSVDVSFDGYGDSGQIESIDAKADADRRAFAGGDRDPQHHWLARHRPDGTHNVHPRRH